MADTDSTPAEGSVTFNVKTSGNQKWTLTLPLNTTAKDLKEKLAGEDYANVPATSQRLILSGKVLKDHETLASHNMKEGNTMHLVKSAASNQRQNPASSTASSTIPNAGTPQQTGVPQNLAAGTGNDPLAGLTGARYAGFAGLPSYDELRNPPTPEDMIRRLQDPNVAQAFNEALQNPQLIDMMINQNPQLRAMGPQARQMLQSPEFRRMMTDPQQMQQMLNMQRMMGVDPFGGMGGFGGAGGQGAFPAPGVTNAAEQQQGQTENQTAPAPANQQNPFAMLGNIYGGMGQNPLATTGAAGGQQPDPMANPFMALLNPMAQAPQGQQAEGNRDAANAGAAPTPANPFAAMMNNPLYAQLMNDPQAAQRALEAILGPGAGNLGGLGGGMGGLGGMGAFGGPPDNRPPEERYSTQLRQLNEMGFHNFDRNIQALGRSGGDVNGALEWLFSQPQ